ncbi:MAG: nuclease-related domain-containing protein [Fibrobacter sp.]|uniref:nuclease-related domain-containing protein n=1 Tax=Fibrobacter sp. TaxID=35828 RepID=UPI002A91E25B|nr:nuclease-related domain-containing protein [Fibrobacter sp.]MDY6262804.1 nuclease-related domain-containing protein [Fibrobacter sp.]
MTFSTLIGIVLLLALIFFKVKGKTPKKNPKMYHSDGRRKTFRDFEQERRKGLSDGIRGLDKPFELGGYGITHAPTRSENFFKPDPKFNDERIANDPRGIFGEAAMMALTARVCDTDKRRYVLMRNLYIPARAGYTEIDALLLHQSGIYVLESKNLSGEISGDLESERWNQHLNASTEHTFHNPIRQNIGHILALEHFLKIRHEQAHFISFVVFSDRCTLRKVPKDNEFWSIVHCSELQEALLKRITSRKTIYSPQQLEDFYYKLQSCMNVSEEVKKQHREYANARGNKT